MTYEEPNRPAIREVENWGSRSHRELYESVHVNNDPGQAAALASEWATMGENIGEAAQEVAQGLRASETGWQGASATKARDSMMQLSTWGTSAAQTATGIGVRVADQASIAQKARDTMPEPVEFDMGAMLMRGFATGGLIGLAIAAADVKVASDRANAAHQQAVTVMATMENESRAVDNNVPVFAMPPNPVRGEESSQMMGLRGTTAPDGGVQAGQLRRGDLLQPAMPDSGVPAGQNGGAIDPASIDARMTGSRMDGGAPGSPGGGAAGMPGFAGGDGPPGGSAFAGGNGGAGGGPGGGAGGGAGAPPPIPDVTGGNGGPAGFASPADQFLASTAGGAPGIPEGGGSSGSSMGGSNLPGGTAGQSAGMPPLPGSFGPTGSDFTSQRPGMTGTAPQNTPGMPPGFTMPGGVPGSSLGGDQEAARRRQQQQQQQSVVPPVIPIPPIGGGPSGSGFSGGGFSGGVPNIPGSNIPGSNIPGSNIPGSSVPGGGVPGGGARPPGSFVPPPPFQPPPSGISGTPTAFGGGTGPGGGSGGIPGGGGGGVPGIPGGGAGGAAAAAAAGRMPGGPGSLAGVGPVGGVPPEERAFGPRGGAPAGPGGSAGMGGAMGPMGGGGGARGQEDAERKMKYVDGEQIIEVPGAELPPSVIGGAKPKKKQD